jgi:signal transduction histidine kinase/HD-GYP domain-containing protein (c-di-GMP phosphodiesterase class II)
MNGFDGPHQSPSPGGGLARLGSFSFALQAATDPDTLFHALADHVLDLAGADQFALLLLNEESGDLEGYAYERDRAGARYLQIAPDPHSFLGIVLRREALVSQEPHEVQHVGQDEIGWSGAAATTLAGVPVLVGPALLGVMVVGYRHPRPISTRRRRTLLFLADQIGLAVDRLRVRADLHAATRRLDEVRAALRRLDQTKSDLISVVSHEMRTPLTAIKAYTESLLDNLDQPSFAMQEKFLHVINEESDRLARMVNDVLDLSRIDSGRRKLRAEPLLVSAVVADALPTVEPLLEQRGLHARVEIPAGMPRVEADLDLLKQIFVNLLHNAAKFSPAGRDIVVRAAAAGDRLRVEVEDHGNGIPPEKLAYVFERFYRVEDGSGVRSDGTGLGLAIVKSAVELHGGSIHAESEVGVGTRFVFDLPLQQRAFRTLIRSLEPLFVQPELRAVLQQCVTMVAEVMEARIVSFMFLDEEGVELRIQAAHGLDIDTVGRTRVRVGDSIAGWVAHTGEALLVEDVETDRRFRKMNHPQYETHSLLGAPLQIGGETVGVVNVNNKTSGAPFDEDDLRLLVAVTARVAAALDRLHDHPTEPELSATLASLRAVIRARRQRLLPSTQRAFKLATELGRRLALPDEDVEVLGYVARVHDVGMLSVEDSQWSSHRVWSERERRGVESHPQSSVRLLRPIDSATKVHEIILAHHEHVDGSGYPRGLRGDQIPVAARILAVVDAFESLTVGRPYREPVSDDEALAELRRASGTQFDPVVVEALAAVLSERRGAEGGTASGGNGVAPDAAPAPITPAGPATNGRNP